MKKIVAESLNESVQSRGRTQAVLDYIRDAGPEGRRYSDIIKFAYEDRFGPGTYTREKRGWWSGAFKTPSRDDRGHGHLMKYIVKADNGKWVLRDEKMSPEEAIEQGRSFMWPNKTQYKEDNYPSRPNWKKDYDEKTGRYKPTIMKQYADKKVANGEISKEDLYKYYNVFDEDAD